MLLEFDIETPLDRDRFDLPRDSFYRDITWFWVQPGTGFLDPETVSI